MKVAVLSNLWRGFQRWLAGRRGGATTSEP